MPEKMLSETEGYDLLDEHGIPVPPHRLVTNAEDAAEAAESIGPPVVMKVISPQIIHKSDVGGVVTGIETAKRAKAVFNDIMEKSTSRAPEAEITGIVVEKQMPPGLEVLIGGKTDPAFGKIVTFGLGGKLVELLHDVSIRVLPISRDDARKMVREIEGYRLIRGYRGEAPKDEEMLVDTLTGMSRIFQDHPEMREFDLNPVILYEKGARVVDARIIMDGAIGPERIPPRVEAAEEIFFPQSIAVIGASSNPRKVGYAVFRNLLEFPGRLYPINPNRTELFGRDVYPSISDVTEPVDCAVISVPARYVPATMEECGKKGVKLAVIVTAGFREAGEEGRQLEEEVMRIAKQYGTRVVGPNCLGIMLPHQGINATFDPVSPKPGHIAFISQSGAIITTVVDWSLSEDIGFSAVFSVGNQADLGFEHYLKFVEEHPVTRAIILYIEEIKNGRSFMKIVEEVGEKKPIIIIKSGSSQKGKQAASSHTGSLAGSHEVYMAAFKQAGVIPATDLREAFQLAELLASEGYPKGKRAIAITSAGGFGVLASDYAEKYGLTMVDLPEEVRAKLDAFLPKCWSRANPMDLLGDTGVDRFAAVFDIMIRHQDFWDVAFVIAVPTMLTNPTHLANEIVRFSRHTDKMVVGCVLGGDSMKSGLRILRSCSIPNFSELEDAFRAVGSIFTARGDHPDGGTRYPPPEGQCMWRETIEEREPIKKAAR